MGESSRRASLLDKLARSVRLAYDEDRRNNPHRFIEPGAEILFVENVAQLLGCGLDHVRRIPRNELPARREGARLLYLRADVIAYVRSSRDRSTAVQHVAPLTPRHGPKAKLDTDAVLRKAFQVVANG